MTPERTHRGERRRSGRRRSAIGSLGLLAMLAACTTESTPPTASLVPLVPPEILPVSTPAPSTTVASSSDPNSPLLAALPDTECGYADPVPDGELTFVVADRLYGASFDATIVRCLAVLGAGQRGTVSWSPNATRALLAFGTIFDVQGVRASGFDVANTEVTWEYPDGAGVFAPTSSDRTLVRRDAVDPNQRADVTFLGRTTAAIAHPGGGVRLAAGQAEDGTPRGVRRHRCRRRRPSARHDRRSRPSTCSSSPPIRPAMRCGCSRTTGPSSASTRSCSATSGWSS